MFDAGIQEDVETIEPKIIKTIRPTSPENLDEIFKYLACIEFGHYMLFDDYEVYDTESESSVYLKNAEEVLDYELDGKKIKEHISDFECNLME